MRGKLAAEENRKSEWESGGGREGEMGTELFLSDIQMQFQDGVYCFYHILLVSSM